MSISLGIMIILIVFLSGCPGEAKVTELEYWTLTSRKDLTVELIAQYNEANPEVNLIYSLNSGNDQMQNLKVAASSGTLPDIWFNWGGSLGSFYAETGVAMDLSAYAKANNWDTKFNQAAIALCTFDGKLGGYPIAMSMIGIFYRKDIFEANGLSIPTTYEEFENVMAVLKAAGYAPLALCGKNGFHTMRYVEALIEMYAGSALRDDLYTFKASWDNPAVVKAFAKFKEQVDKGYFPEGFVSLDAGDARGLLYQEKCVMDIEGPWMENNIFTDGQDLSLFGYFKLPLSAKGNRMSGFAEMIQFNANLSDAELAAAMKFVDFHWSPEAVAQWGSMIKQPIPRSDNVIPEKLPMTKLMVADAGEYNTYTITDQALPQEVLPSFYEAQDSVALGSKTPEEAAKLIQAAVEAFVAAQ